MRSTYEFQYFVQPIVNLIFFITRKFVSQKKMKREHSHSKNTKNANSNFYEAGIVVHPAVNNLIYIAVKYHRQFYS